MNKKAIVCVDDEAIILLSVVQELKRAFGQEFMYEYALNAETALDTIDRLVGDDVTILLIISDWLMPGMKGDEFIATVHSRYPGIQAIIITGHADRAAIDKMTSSNDIAAVLKKPWNSRELIQLVTSASNA